jgi:DNA-binding NtrC family response regulator
LFEEDFLAGLAHHSWPGNVRELRNYIEQCVAFRREMPFRRDEASQETGERPRTRIMIGKSYRDARECWNAEFEREYLEQLLESHGDNISAAARAAGLGRTYFYRLLWRHGLRDPGKGQD